MCKPCAPEASFAYPGVMSDRDDVSFLQRCVSAAFRAEIAAQRSSGKELASKVGRSQNYVATRLRDEKPFTLDDVEAICDELFVDDPERVIVDAVERFESVASTRPRVASGGDATPLRQMSAGSPPSDVSLVAARTVGERPEHAAAHRWDDIGEEPQTPLDTPA